MMNKHTPLKISGSLLERASELYDFRKSLRGPAAPDLPEARDREEEGEVREPDASAPAPAPYEVEAAAETPRQRKQPIIMSNVEVSFEEPQSASGADDFMEPAPAPAPAPAAAPARKPAPAGARRGKVDREALREAGFVLPDAPVSGLAEEFRIIKRQLLQAASGTGGIAADKRQTILVCSASPDEGKTFCAVNLALSLASEKDVEVLLVDGDVAKPEILSILGMEGGPGLIDAIADPACDPNDFVIQSDIDRLSVLPAGRQANNVPELLASERTRHVLAALTENHPRRIVIFDSPPALMASPASVLAGKVGQVMMVVRADKTTEADLREAIGLLSGCETISLMLNGAGFPATGRRFGSYYGYGQ
jgi:exopolysaccharide/PEP-CTERM locus tyrosine autokinase